MYYTRDGDEVVRNESTGHEGVVIYYANGYPDGSGTVRLTKEDLLSMIELLEDR